MKNTVSDPAKKPTTYSCASPSTPIQYATGTEQRITARPRSATISTGRRASLSTHTPAGSASTRNGIHSTVLSTATSNVVAWSTTIATSGSASSVIWLPNSLTV